MKKYLYLLSGVGLALFSTSCKKDYDCECTDEDGDKSTVTLKEVTKKQAKVNCLSTETTYSYSYTDYDGNTTTYSETYKLKCELK